MQAKIFRLVFLNAVSVNIEHRVWFAPCLRFRPPGSLHRSAPSVRTAILDLRSPLLIHGTRTMPGRTPSRFRDRIRKESVAKRRGKLEWRLSSYESRLSGETPGQIGLETR